MRSRYFQGASVEGLLALVHSPCLGDVTGVRRLPYCTQQVA